MDKLLTEISQAAEIVQVNGINDYSRVETARMLGLNQMTQFDKQKTLRLDLGCWFLAQLSKSQLEDQKNFVNTCLFPSFTPGEIENLVMLKELLDSSRIKQDYHLVIIGVLHEGKDLDDFGFKGTQKQNLIKALESIKSRFNETEGKGYNIDRLLAKIDAKLDKLSPEFFIQLVTQSSKERVKGIVNGDKAMLPNELATVYAAGLMPESRMAVFERDVVNALQSVECYRYENYILIKKLSPVLVDIENPVKPPLWVRFFDHDVRSKAPLLKDLHKVSMGIEHISGKKASEVRAALDEIYGPNSRARIYPFSKTKEMVDGGASLFEAHRKLDPDVDVGQFYRAYEKWIKEWHYNEYWKQG